MACNCVVIVREVWDTRDLTGSPLDEGGGIRNGALTTRMEPEDLNALEAALRIVDEHGGTVTALAIGAPRDVDVLKECLYRGAHAAQRVDADPAALDTHAAAALLAESVKRLGSCDLLLTGVTVADGENALLGAQVAALLGVEQASYVDGVVGVDGGKVVAKRAIEMGYEDVELTLPAVLTIGVALVEDDPRTPRSAKAMLKLKHKKTEVPSLSVADLGVDTASRRTQIAGHEAVEERVIETTSVDPESETALKEMLDSVLKGA